MSKGKIKFFRAVLGNIVMCATVAALLIVAVTSSDDAAAALDRPYYSGKSSTRVSLMINVYWGTEYIPQMLEILDRHGAKTTFFVGGSWAAANPETLKAIAARGHEIGNHGYYHKDHSALDEAYNRKEIVATHEAVKDILGVEMNLFAPPSGAFGEVALSVAEKLGYRTVMWTRDTIDWRDKDSALVFKRATRDLKGGDLILMHPTEHTVKALDGILTAIESAGLSVARVGEVLDGDEV